MDAHSEKILAQLIRETRIAVLSTLRDEEPLSSLVAFAPLEDFSAFYIHTNRLAQHTIDMKKKRQVSLLIAEADDGRADPQTLARVSIRGSAEMLENGAPGYTPVKELYLARFPEAAQTVQLDDFNFWRIKPKGGRYVLGLAKAYNITIETLQKVSERS
ncbi:MAG: pyridoxamine 5'-phosphate oxidase family protein [Anaerolineales bacterium]|nr:pyridoxamine 5'-phosphate oxidase family protein [Anaerolineales bacterium]MCZ2122552.1 pyridoxamine 5'-phosphate oxidase family protein [Anaerolineales bacterium]